MKDRLPAHVAVIMDGNGRWAAMRGLPRVEGHRRGAERAKEVITASVEMGLGTLTLYTFSVENWQRPEDEVSLLMKLLEAYLRREASGLVRNGVRFRAIGQTWKLPGGVRALIRDLEEKTAQNTGLTLVAALSYGGRDEIVRAVRKALAAGVEPGGFTEEALEGHLDTAGLPEPDLIIRTSGEMRLSNFLLWQSAYSELYFTSTLWPDFSKDEFLRALHDYRMRERRFGAVHAKETG
ncbi:MAG: polyprenyl diphosphate synthase [Nitrospirota bacterium]|jgi:undecaprenyl diphosphate synthase